MIELNYFDCRGRVQAIRNYLHERDIPFVDNRVSVKSPEEWALKSQDANLSGSLGLLPTARLAPQGPLVSETLVIAFELAPNMTLTERAMISSAYDDVIENVGLLLWADFACPGVDVKAMAAIMFQRMMKLFAHYENSPVLADNGERFFSLAQHFVGEAIDAARYVFDEKFDAFLKDKARLSDFDNRYSEFRTRFARPSQFTGRPDEANSEVLRLCRG